MKRLFASLAATGSILGMLSFLSFGFSPQGVIWRKNSRGIHESLILTMKTDSQNPDIIYAGTRDALYRSENAGRDFFVALQPGGEVSSVYDIDVDPQNGDVYAATGSGLYKGRDGNWRKIFGSSDEDREQCLSVLAAPTKIFVGTRKGMFFREKSREQWQRIDGKINEQPVFHIKGRGGLLYAATGSDLFRIGEGRVKMIFKSGFRRTEEDNGGQTIRDIALIEGEPSAVIVGTTKGIYLSRDAGDNWRRVPAENVALNHLRSLIVFQKKDSCSGPEAACLTLVAGTSRGAFLYFRGSWTPLYKGLETNNVRYLAADTRSTVYAATDSGVYVLPLKEALSGFDAIEARGDPRSFEYFGGVDKTRRGDYPRSFAAPDSYGKTRRGDYPRSFAAPDSYGKTRRGDTEAEMGEFRDYREIKLMFLGEPTIRDVHEIAVQYAEVHPDKIRQWRRLAKKRALFPKLDIGLDAGRDWDRSDSVFGSSSGKHHIAPDDKSFGEDAGIDISLTWDLADYVWSSDQTSIDSRSKLMVELREDILDQVTRLYFERRRLQVELVLAGQLDQPAKLDKQMRVEELTALIDAFTGGEFSRRIEKGKERPEARIQKPETRNKMQEARSKER